MTYNGYRITVEKLTPNGHTLRQAEIVLTSDYTLIDDISEWVRVEIDKDASITVTENDPTAIATCPKTNDGRHQQRAGWYNGTEIEFCQACGLTLRVIDPKPAAIDTESATVIDTEKCPVTKSAHIPVTEMGVTTCEECAYVIAVVWHAP